MGVNVTASPNRTHSAVSRYMLDAGAFLPDAGQTHVNVEAIARHIVCGDAIEVLSKLPAESVDLVHTSPPYNIDKPYESSLSDRASAQEYQDFLCAAITELKRDSLVTRAFRVGSAA